MAEAGAWRTASVPKTLYKYFPFSANAMSLLANQRIWMASLESLNDPFEVVRRVGIGLSTDDEIRAIAADIGGGRDPEEIRELIGHAIEQKQELDRLIDRCGVASFSEIHDCPLMWAHYAGGHSGFVVEFEFDEEHGDQVMPVEYGDSFKFNWVDYLKQPSVEMLDDLRVRSVTLKPSAWSYEKEWRLVTTYAEAEGDPDIYRFSQFPGKVVSLRFGAKMKIPQACAIARIIHGQNADNNVKFIKMTFDRGSFVLRDGPVQSSQDFMPV